jgi:H+/Cl- antiporter ClcA
MNLTEDEKFMVYRLRQKQKAWFGLRWTMLALGFVEACVGIYFLWLWINSQRFRFNVIESLTLALAWLIFLGLGIILIGYAKKNWQGNPVLTVLLKLVDHCSQDDRPKN